MAAPEASLSEQRAFYKTHVKSRNHGLDLLPLFKSADPEGYARDFPKLGDIAARPAFHFRLPDCRLDDPNWSLAVPWSQWQAVEALAADPMTLAALSEAWRSHRAQLISTRRGWAEQVDALLPDALKPLERSLF
jgi:hypothetical protein